MCRQCHSVPESPLSRKPATNGEVESVPVACNATLSFPGAGTRDGTLYSAVRRLSEKPGEQRGIARNVARFVGDDPMVG